MKKLSFLIAVAMLISLCGCAANGPTSDPSGSSTKTLPPSQTSASSPDTATKPPPKPEFDCSGIVSEMTLRQKLGQMMMMDFRTWQADGQEKPSNVTSINDEIIRVINGYSIGNTILFAENFGTIAETVALTDALQTAAGDIPMLIGTDQEGGSIVRMAYGCSMPGNMALGAIGNPEVTENIMRITGAELAAVGVNVDFAPVVDVNNNPENPVIGLRSFGSDSEAVALHGAAAVRGLHGAGIASAVKHFPGHGDTATDSHSDLPVINKSTKELEKAELLPFKTAIEAGTDIIMTAHIRFPALEPDTAVPGGSVTLPATLSPKILTGLLRETLGFNGVIATDSLRMKAITDNFGETDAVLRAISAGADLLVMCAHVDSMAAAAKLEKIYLAVEAAVNDGSISEKRLDESVTRILALKNKLGLFEKPAASIDERTAMAERLIASPENRAIERSTAAAAITVLKDELPAFVPSAGERILFVCPYQNEIGAYRFALRRLQADGKLPGVTADSYCYNKESELSSELKKKINAADYVILVSEGGGAAEDSWLVKLPIAACGYASPSKKKLAAVSAGLPYDAEWLGDAAPVLMLCYNDKGMPDDVADGELDTKRAYGVNIPAALDVIFGKYNGRGTLPVSITDADGNFLFPRKSVVRSEG